MIFIQNIYVFWNKKAGDLNTKASRIFLSFRFLSKLIRIAQNIILGG